MALAETAPLELESEAGQVYRGALDVLTDAGVPFLVGGAYSLAQHAGIVRHTKDFDLFVRPADGRRVLALLGESGFRTELTFPHWLGKAFRGEYFVDVIFSSGNGLATVDDEWFEHAVPAEILGMTLRLCPAEEMIWSKAFVQERERYDGADVAHLLRATGPKLDWRRLLRRFGPHWRVLLGHLVLFGYVYPSERTAIPTWVLEELWQRLRRESAVPGGERVCQGTLLSREQYLPDIEQWGYVDARERPRGPMSAEAITHWTAAIDTGK
jgi:hypothetical protein